MRLKELKRKDALTLFLTWDDGHSGPVMLRSLRDACPCAGCQGETVLFAKYVPPKPDTGVPGRYELVSAAPVGSYALRLTWGDGHDHGMYTWEHLRSLCECEVCLSRRRELEGN